MEALTRTWVVSTASPRATFGYQVRSHSPNVLSFPSRSHATSGKGLGLFSSASRPWGSLTVQGPRRETDRDRPAGGPLRAAQEAAQAEEGTEEELQEGSDESTNGSPSTSPSLLEEFKAAIAANDEQSIARLEAELGVLHGERDALAKQVDALVEESHTARERLLRLNADFDNFRKRSQTEKANLSSSVRGDVIETLLPMVDNFERAQKSIRVETEAEEKIDRSYQGIYKQFVEIMKGLGVVAVETVGKEFDPNVHEAIMREDSSEYDEGIVVQEFRRGFCIGDRLMRPAMVKVSAGPGPGKDADFEEDQVADVSQVNGDEVEKAA